MKGENTGGSISGSYESHDKEQINRATVTEGEITIRNQDEQTQDVATLNREVLSR